MLVLSTAWYKIKSKYNFDQYYLWLDNFLNNVNNFYLVVYTNFESKDILIKYENNKKIKFVILDFNQFYNYKYKNYWIENHNILSEKNIKVSNDLYQNKISWELNMLWSEKISLVKRTFFENHFNGEWYGWCDIGYFRNRSNDLSNEQLINWPSNQKLLNLNVNKIYYAKINESQSKLNIFKELILNIDRSNFFPDLLINQHSFAGGFFLIHRDKIDWWHRIYDNTLKDYFKKGYPVKDDQIIILTSILKNPEHFTSIIESDPKYDKWFVFQRFLI